MQLLVRYITATAILANITLLTGCALSPANATPAFSVQRDLVYAAPAGKEQLADVYIPAGEGPFPAVLVIHGGGWVRGERDDMERYAVRLVNRGFVAVNIAYRLAPGAIYPAQLEDCRAAVRWMRTNAIKYNIDPARVGALGYSAGAHLALLLGVKGEDGARVSAVVAGSAPTDLRKYPDSELVRSLLGGPPDGREALYESASPIAHVSSDDAPTFLYHGRIDTLVAIEQSRDMERALRTARVSVTLSEQPFGHTLTYLLDSNLFEQMADFFELHLKGT